MSWTNLVDSLGLELWDLDTIPGTAGESVAFVSSATASALAIHPTDVWNPATQTLSGDGTANDNALPRNFSRLRFANPAGFDSITFNWSVASGTGTTGIGHVGSIVFAPEPTTLALLGLGLAGVGFGRRRRR